jgi:hypothetical protein
MLDGAQIFHAVALLLQRVIRSGAALHIDAVGLQLKGLAGVSVRDVDTSVPWQI